MTDSLPADSLAARFAQRLTERDNPAPVVVSHDPAAVEARLHQWLRTGHGVGDLRSRRRLGQMLLALMEHPERTTAQLRAAAGLGLGMSVRAAARLGTLGLTATEKRGHHYYHRLLPAAEDALLLVVAGPDAAAELRRRAAVPSTTAPGPPT